MASAIEKKFQFVGRKNKGNNNNNPESDPRQQQDPTTTTNATTTTMSKMTTTGISDVGVGYGCKLCAKRAFVPSQLLLVEGGESPEIGILELIVTVHKNADEVPHLAPDDATNVAQYVNRKVKKVEDRLRDEYAEKFDRQKQKMGLFERDEIQVGPLLGVGGFSSVYRIDGFKPKNNNNNNINNNNNGGGGGDSSATTTATGSSTGNDNDNNDNNDATQNNNNNNKTILDPTGTYSDHEVLAREFIAANAIRKAQKKKQQHQQQQQPLTKKNVLPKPRSKSMDHSGPNNGTGDGEDNHHRMLKRVNTDYSHGDHGSSNNNNSSNNEDPSFNKYRYALKHLTPATKQQSLKRFAGAATDLVAEGQFLLTMDHPNIIRIRGYTKDGPNGYKTGKHDGYFLIIDLLPETLEDRILRWRKTFNQNRPNLWEKFKKFSVKAKKSSARSKSPPRQHPQQQQSQSSSQQQSSQQQRQQPQQQLSNQQAQSQNRMVSNPNTPRGKKEMCMRKLFVERLKVAFDVSGALEYLHRRRICYRDLKSANIGFDIRGDVKLYDFGLARFLPQKTTNNNNKNSDAPPTRKQVIFGYGSDDIYLMSSVGTPSYMAPEVKDARNQKYGLAADVYSFGVLLWELLSMSSPRNGKMPKQHKDKNRIKHDRYADNDNNNNNNNKSGRHHYHNDEDLKKINEINKRQQQEEKSPFPATPDKNNHFPMCSYCWPKDVRDLLTQCLSRNQFHRPTMRQVRQTLLKILMKVDKKKNYDLGNRRRSTEVLEFSDEFLSGFSGHDLFDSSDGCLAIIEAEFEGTIE